MSQTNSPRNSYTHAQAHDYLVPSEPVSSNNTGYQYGAGTHAPIARKPIATFEEPLTRLVTIQPNAPASNKVDWDDYFSGPHDPTRHSKLPMFLRLHGSILPKLVVPILFVGAWSATITVISKYHKNLGVDSILLTVLGFVVGLSLSFRSSTAYERYGEGRKFWAQIILHSRNLGRLFWVHAEEREGPEGKEDVLNKLSAVNLILAFAQAVKHKLRHEPEYDYADLKPLINHLETFAKNARGGDAPVALHNETIEKTGNKESWGEYLGIPFWQSNPRKALKQAAKQGLDHGNLPLEVMNHIGAYINMVIKNGTLSPAILHTQVFNSVTAMMDAYGGCERVLATPLPIAYGIAISQITWLYVMVLPFQLYNKLGWITIPGTIVAAYIILGIAAIGGEIEDPFGRDVNDLDLDRYCNQLAHDLNIITSIPPPKSNDFLVGSHLNLPLWPYSLLGYTAWREKSMAEIREAAKGRVNHRAEPLSFDTNQRVQTFAPSMAMNQRVSTYNPTLP